MPSSSSPILRQKFQRGCQNCLFLGNVQSNVKNENLKDFPNLLLTWKLSRLPRHHPCTVKRGSRFLWRANWEGSLWQFMAAPFLRWQLPDSQIRLRLLHLNVYQLDLLQRKDLHILSFSRMEIYPTRFVSTRFVSIRGHQFFCYPSNQKWQSEAIRFKNGLRKTNLSSCFIGAYLPNVCWTVTNWGQASVSLNRRPSQRSQINSLHDISGRTLR